MLPAEDGIVVRIAAHVGNEFAAALVLVVVLVGPGAVHRQAEIAIGATAQARIQAHVDAVGFHFTEVVVQVENGERRAVGVAQEQGLVFLVVAIDRLLWQRGNLVFQVDVPVVDGDGDFLDRFEHQAQGKRGGFFRFQLFITALQLELLQVAIAQGIGARLRHAARAQNRVVVGIVGIVLRRRRVLFKQGRCAETRAGRTAQHQRAVGLVAQGQLGIGGAAHVAVMVEAGGQLHFQVLDQRQVDFTEDGLDRARTAFGQRTGQAGTGGLAGDLAVDIEVGFFAPQLTAESDGQRAAGQLHQFAAALDVEARGGDLGALHFAAQGRAVEVSLAGRILHAKRVQYAVQHAGGKTRILHVAARKFLGRLADRMAQARLVVPASQLAFEGQHQAVRLAGGIDLPLARFHGAPVDAQRLAR